MLNFLTPIISFMATVVVTIVLSGNSEIIAAYSTGIRFIRVLYPYILFAILISIFSFLLCGWLIPESNKKRIIFEINYLNRRAYNNLKDIHLQIDDDRYAYAQIFDAYQGIGYNFTLESISGILEGKLFAESIVWMPQKKLWRAKNWTLRKIVNEKETLKSGELIDLNLNMDPSDFGGDFMIREMVNMGTLDIFINKLKRKNSDALYLFKVEKYTRYMYPFSVILLVILGMVFASRRIRGGAIWQMILSFILAIGYIAMFMFASNRAESHSENILLTIWMPNILFSIVVFLIYRFVPK